MNELTSPIPYIKTLYFFYDLPYGNAPEGATESYQSIQEATGINQEIWEKMNRTEQDFAISQAFQE